MNTDADFAILPQGMTVLRAGDVINIRGGVHMVIRVNESNATVAAAARKERTVTEKLTGKWVTFTVPSNWFWISTTLSNELVLERQGAAGLKYFLENRAVRGYEDKPNTTATTADEGENSMATKKKDAKAKSTKAAKKPQTPMTGQPTLCGASVRSVIRALGARGFSGDDVKAILAAQNITVPSGAVPNEIKKGLSGKFPVAELTKDQVAELNAKIPAEAAAA